MQSETSAYCTFVCFMQNDNFRMMNVSVSITLRLFRFPMKDCNLFKWASWPQRLSSPCLIDWFANLIRGRILPRVHVELAVSHFAYNSTFFKCHDHMQGRKCQLYVTACQDT